MENNELSVIFEVDGEQVKLSPKICQDYIVSGEGKLTLPEFKFFTTLCKKLKLNPYAKDCYIMKYNDEQPATIITSKDVFYRRAMSHPDFGGVENGVIVRKQNGNIEERKGGFVAKDEVLEGAWAKAYRKSIEYPYYVSLSLDEVIQRKKDGKPNIIWATKPAMMSIKVATARALRDMFTEEFGHVYDSSEINTNESANVSGFTEEDLNTIEVNEKTGEVKEENVIDIEEL